MANPYLEKKGDFTEMERANMRHVSLIKNIANDGIEICLYENFTHLAYRDKIAVEQVGRVSYLFLLKGEIPK